jgi:outer membrane immunogenic protein
LSRLLRAREIYLNSNWLIGIEGEAGYVHLSRTIQDINAINDHFSYPASLDTTRLGDWYGVIAGRVGFTADRVLFYGKGGVAFVNKSYSFADNCGIPCGGGPALLDLTHSDTQVTWAAGAGIEYAFAPNWSVKGEYLYLAAHESFTSAGVESGSGATATNVHTDPGIHTAKVGFNYRFGGPIVAKY